MFLKLTRKWFGFQHRSCQVHETGVLETWHLCCLTSAGLWLLCRLYEQRSSCSPPQRLPVLPEGLEPDPPPPAAAGESQQINLRCSQLFCDQYFTGVLSPVSALQSVSLLVGTAQGQLTWHRSARWDLYLSTWHLLCPRVTDRCVPVPASCPVLELRDDGSQREEPCGRPALPEHRGYCQ